MYACMHVCMHMYAYACLPLRCRALTEMTTSGRCMCTHTYIHIHTLVYTRPVLCTDWDDNFGAGPFLRKRAPNRKAKETASGQPRDSEYDNNTATMGLETLFDSPNASTLANATAAVCTNVSETLTLNGDAESTNVSMTFENGTEVSINGSDGAVNGSLNGYRCYGAFQSSKGDVFFGCSMCRCAGSNPELCRSKQVVVLWCLCMLHQIYASVDAEHAGDNARVSLC